MSVASITSCTISILSVSVISVFTRQVYVGQNMNIKPHFQEYIITVLAFTEISVSLCIHMSFKMCVRTGLQILPYY